MPENIKLSALTESTDEQMRDGALMLNSVIDSGSSTGFSSKKTPFSRFANYILNKFAGLSLAGENQTVKDAIDGIAEKKADKSGTYDDMRVGTAKQLLSDSYTEDFTPYKFRRSPYTDRLSESIVGASVAWNQLVNTSDTSVTVPNGHKYLSRISGTDALGASTGTAISVTGTDNVHDLTAMFGTAVADALYAMGADGIALFRSWYPKAYYEYSAPTMEHVSGLEAHEMVVFNQFDKDNLSPIIYGYLEYETKSIKRNSGHVIYYVTCLPNTKYCATRKAVIKNERFAIADFDGVPQVGATFNSLSRASQQQVVGNDMTITLTTGPNAKYLAIWAYWDNAIDALNTLCVNISDPTRNGTYEPYKKYSYPLDSSLILRGLLKYDATKGIYADGDIYSADGTVTRKYGIRAYQSGDESNTAVLTDGTNTVYELATPTTESAEPFEAMQITDGTEEYVTDCLVPVGHESKYYQNLRSKIEGLPTDFSAIICATEATNKASKNYAVGDYLIYGNTLYKVTSAIATNAALTVGTNISATTIMAEIKALQ